MKNIVIFASGKGSNAENIIKYFEKSNNVQISLVVCNNEKAGVLNIAFRHNIPVLLINKQSFEQLAETWQNEQFDLIVLAGFLWQIPSTLIHRFQNKIINIHPSLLPKYGGRGMYGKNVHEAVIKNHETESGITIHFVNEHYDEGKIILQKACAITQHETIETLAEKIHELEHEYLPAAIEKILE